MCCFNICGCHNHRRRRCSICDIFRCFCGGRRRRGCFCNRGRRCERFTECEVRESRFERDVLERSDFDGFFPEARFERVTRECRCRR